MLMLSEILDLLGTIAFAVSGAALAIQKKMDIFGVNVLAVVTAIGGGVLRDSLIGALPPASFMNPFYVTVAVLTANTVFLVMYFQPPVPARASLIYDGTMFWFDTLGIAAFTVDGVMLGVERGFVTQTFLLTFLGVVTGVGGGVIRDLLANQMPSILRKRVYAVASIAGGALMAAMLERGIDETACMLTGFAVVVLIRILAAHFRWNLPSVPGQRDA